MLFFISLLLLVWSSLRWAARLAGTAADGFWIFVASVMLQLGAIASLTSLFHQMTPVAWVLVQVLVCAVTLPLTGGVRRPTLRGLPVAWHGLRAKVTAFAAGLSLWGGLALIAVCGIILVSLVKQAVTPILNFDEKMYHASRVIYWIQFHSVFPYETHNIRQTMLPFGSELFFLWPVLLTKAEWVGRLVFWLAYPLASIGQYLLLRAMKLSQTVALAGVLILISTPLVATSAIGLKPEIWSIVALLGIAYWGVAVCSRPETMKLQCFFLGIFTVLSINVRPFSVVFLPVLLLILVWTPGQFSFARRLKALTAGLVCAALLSTLLIPLAFNSARYRHPLGPQEARRIVVAEVTPRVMYTHAVRFAFLLLELPSVPVSAEARSGFSGEANQFISTLGAGTPLSGEDDRPWPGRFVYALPEHATRFSLWGVLWIPALLLAAALLIRNGVTTWPRVRLTAVSAQTLLAIPLLGAILFGARWMVESEVPGRYLIGPYALLLPVGIALIAPAVSARKFLPAIIAIVLAYSVFPQMRAMVDDARLAIAAPASDEAVNEPFGGIVGSMLPDGSRILFVGHRNARDYPLFSPGTHYSNMVIPWGTGAFAPARMRELIVSEKLTHILIENDERVKLLGFPAIETREMTRWLTLEAGLKAVPLRAPGMRLFEVSDATAMNERAFETTELPPAAPLIAIADTLNPEVGLDPTVLETPWPIEKWGGGEGGFLWIGQGHAEGIDFALWSRQDRDVNIRFNVFPGPGLPIPDRRFMVLQDGGSVGDVQTFQGEASAVHRTRLHAGRNIISFFALDAATIKPLPNGDTRNLVVGLHEIRIESAPVAEAGDSRPDSPNSGSRDAGHPANNDLAQSARMAVGLISDSQQADGYWLTAYTGGERFENPKLEMNTYVTSIMVDILGAKPALAGLEGTLERARIHLRGQIEAGGLVRYHGRPGAPAMTALGLCPITPDADDTALVWRIAPGDKTLRPAALSTLRQYRTAEGLYKTWLAQRDAYRCLNIGDDPNPTDVGIQMHVLMMLAQADPPAARSLCSALRRTIDQDRIWVYYRRAPLVPVMRLADLKAAGCELRLPASRSQTPISGQEIWLQAADLLRRLEEGKAKPSASAEALALLRALAKDDFSSVQLNPPLLYHNDLTASVKRFYWSEDAGYALWLRLYGESSRRGLLPVSDAAGAAAVSSRTVQ